MSIIAANTFAAAASTKMAVQLVSARYRNSQILSSTHDSIIDDISEIESPTDFGGSFINSALEDGKIPLILILNGLNFFNYLEFSCILSLFLFLFRKYLKQKIKFVYLKLTNRGVESIKDENITLKKAFNTLDKYGEYIVLYVLICFFWIKLIHININIDLASNIDSYVDAYLILKKK